MAENIPSVPSPKMAENIQSVLGPKMAVNIQSVPGPLIMTEIAKYVNKAFPVTVFTLTIGKH